VEWEDMTEKRKGKKGMRIEDRKEVLPIKRLFALRQKYICSYVIQAS
jgi:hypothetical protein